MLPLASWLAWTVLVRSQTQDCLLSLARIAGLGTKLAYKLRFSHFISRTANFRPSQQAYSNTRVMRRWAKANATSRTCCLQKDFPVFETTAGRLPEPPGGRSWDGISEEVVHWYSKSFLRTPDLAYFLARVWVLPIILEGTVNFSKPINESVQYRYMLIHSLICLNLGLWSIPFFSTQTAVSTLSRFPNVVCS